MSGFRSLALSVLCVATMAAPAAAQDRAQIPTPVEVSLSRAEVSTQLGESFGFRSRVTNSGAQPISGLVAHLNVVGLDADIYVDPEDWSEDRTRFLPTLGPGETTSVGWAVKAVTGGRAAIYVVVLPGRSEPAVSPAIDVQITETKDLNSGGVLPLALGVPAFLGAVALLVRRRRR